MEALLYVFASLPTGYGKSLIYQPVRLPVCVKELAFRGFFTSQCQPFVLDQVTNLKCRGFTAAVCTRDEVFVEGFDPQNSISIRLAYR